MKHSRKYRVCYYGSLITIFFFLSRTCLPAHNLIFHPFLLLTWIFIIRGIVALWQDAVRFWQWFNGE